MSNGWNVLVYMAADNNLKEEGVFILTEMMKGVTPPIPGVKVTALFDSGKEITLYDFNKSRGGLDPLGKHGKSDAEALNRPDSENLKDFLAQNADRESKNLIVLSGHGGGVVGDFLPSSNPPRALNISTLGGVLKSVCGVIDKKIDVLGMDSCLMSMLEVGYELKEYVNMLVGAQGFARNTGWPYNEILPALRDNPSPETLACTIVKEYVHYYAPYTRGGISVDNAACDLRYISDLANAVKILGLRLRDKLQHARLQYKEAPTLKPAIDKIKRAILTAHWEAQSHKFEQYVDLWDFCDLLKDHCDDGEIKSACWEVKIAVEKVVRVSCYSGSAFQHSHGLSIYFPWAKSDIEKDLPQYQMLAFEKEPKSATVPEPGWGKFLAEYGEATQREVRKNDPNKAGKFEEASMPVEFEIGIGITANVRNNVLRGTDASVFGGTHAGSLVIPKVKNPPDKFLKYEDDCAVDCGKQPVTGPINLSAQEN